MNWPYLDAVFKRLVGPRRVHQFIAVLDGHIESVPTQLVGHKGNRMPKTRPYLDNGFLELDTDVVEQPLSQVFCFFGGFSRHASTIFA